MGHVAVTEDSAAALIEAIPSKGPAGSRKQAAGKDQPERHCPPLRAASIPTILTEPEDSQIVREDKRGPHYLEIHKKNNRNYL